MGIFRTRVLVLILLFHVKNHDYHKLKTRAISWFWGWPKGIELGMRIRELFSFAWISMWLISFYVLKWTFFCSSAFCRYFLPHSNRNIFFSCFLFCNIKKIPFANTPRAHRFFHLRRNWKFFLVVKLARRMSGQSR